MCAQYVKTIKQHMAQNPGIKACTPVSNELMAFVGLVQRARTMPPFKFPADAHPDIGVANGDAEKHRAICAVRALVHLFFGSNGEKHLHRVSLLAAGAMAVYLMCGPTPPRVTNVIREHIIIDRNKARKWPEDEPNYTPYKYALCLAYLSGLPDNFKTTQSAVREYLNDTLVTAPWQHPVSYITVTVNRLASNGFELFSELQRDIELCKQRTVSVSVPAARLPPLPAPASAPAPKPKPATPPPTASPNLASARARADKSARKRALEVARLAQLPAKQATLTQTLAQVSQVMEAVRDDRHTLSSLLRRGTKNDKHADVKAKSRLLQTAFYNKEHKLKALRKRCAQRESEGTMFEIIEGLLERAFRIHAEVMELQAAVAEAKGKAKDLVNRPTNTAADAMVDDDDDDRTVTDVDDDERTITDRSDTE